MDGKNVVFYLATNLFQMYLYYSFFTVFFGAPRPPRWLAPLCFFAFFALNSGVFFLLNNPYFNLMTSVLPLVAISFLYPCRTRIRALVSFMAYATTMLLDSIIKAVMDSILPEANHFKNIPFNSILRCLILFFAILLIKKVRTAKTPAHISWMHWAAIIVIPSGCIAIVAITYRTINVWETIMVVAILLIINWMAFWLFDKLAEFYQDTYEKKLLLQQNNAYVQQLQLIQEREQNIRGVRHDIKNHVAYLSEYLRINDVPGAQRYLQSISEQLHPQKEFAQSGNPNIDSFLNCKLDLLEKMGAHIETEITMPQEVGCSDFHLCIILGNLLDNVTDAFQKMPRENKKDLWIRMKYDRGAFYIYFANSFDGAIKKGKTGQRMVYQTQKADVSMHGIGLSNIERVVEHYGGAVVISDENHIFAVEIILYLG